MTPLLRLLPLVLLPAMAGCFPHARAYVGPAFLRIQGDVALQDSGGTLNLGTERNNFDDQLGQGDRETSLYLRGEVDLGPQRVRVQAFDHSAQGSGTLAGDFGDIAGGSNVTTDLSFVNASGSWTWDILPTSLLRLGVGVQVSYLDLDLTVNEVSSTDFEQIKSELLLPMPCVDAELDFGDFSVGASLSAISADLGDGSGRYWDADAFVRYEPMINVEVIGGARYLLVDASADASGRDVDADFDVFGWFLGVGFAF
jgi:hypothetical protein